MQQTACMVATASSTETTIIVALVPLRQSCSKLHAWWQFLPTIIIAQQRIVVNVLLITMLMVDYIQMYICNFNLPKINCANSFVI